MARLFGFIANRPDILARIAVHEARLLTEPNPGKSLGWGIGFYQGGEVLLRRRPVDDRPVVDLSIALSDVRSDVAIGHVRSATVGAQSTENTHPFRYRQWLFAHTGTVAGFASMRDRLAESIPQFLRRNVRGETDSELLFHLFLSFLHDAGKLGDAEVPTAAVTTALKSSLALVDRLSQEEGVDPSSMNLVVTSGDALVAVHTRASMFVRTFRGRQDLDEILGDDAALRARLPDFATTVATVLVAETSQAVPGFTEVPNRSIVVVPRGADPIVTPLLSARRGGMRSHSGAVSEPSVVSSRRAEARCGRDRSAVRADRRFGIARLARRNGRAGGASARDGARGGRPARRRHRGREPRGVVVAAAPRRDMEQPGVGALADPSGRPLP